MSDNVFEILDKVSNSLRSRDARGIRSLYANDAVIWHANTATSQSADENCAMLASVFELMSELEYRDVRRYLIDGGAVQQHRLSGTFTDGIPMPDLHACLVIKAREGKITEVYEYFDSASWADVWARLHSVTPDLPSN